MTIVSSGVSITPSLPTGGSTGQVLAKTSNTDYDVQWSTGGGGGSGDVVGPASAVDSHFVQFNSTTGKLVKDGGLALTTSTTLAGNSNSNVPSEAAVKAYADAGDATKQATLVSGTNIKTVNSTSLLGSGNVAVQDVLVSGTSIKTINGSSVLGSGNLVVSGTGDVVGPSSAVNNNVAFFDTTTGKLIKDSGLTLSGSNTGDQFTSQTVSTLLGRGSAAGTGAAQAITLGTNLSMSGTTLNASGGGGGGGSTDYGWPGLGITPATASYSTITLSLAIGDNDVYTVPLGQKVIVCYLALLQTSGSSQTAFSELKTGGSYYRLSSNATLTSGTVNRSAVGGVAPPFVFEAGDIIAINSTSTASGLMLILSFANTDVVKTYKVLNVPSGDSTLFTASHDTLVLDSVLRTFNSDGVIHITNTTAGSISVISKYQSGATTLSIFTTSISANSKTTTVDTMIVTIGDLYIINAASAMGTGSMVWVNVVEKP